MTRYLLGGLALAICSLPAVAAPPTLTYLFPAGAQRGQTVEVAAGGTFERWPVGAWADSPALTVKPAKDKGKLSVQVAADSLPGTYWIRLYDAEGATGLRPFLVGTVPEVVEQEPNDDLKKPQTLASAAVVVNGKLAQPGDVDVFALKLTRGQTLVASLESNRTLAAPLDGVLQLVSADGFVREQSNDYNNLDPQVVYTAPADGTYFVRIFAFPVVPDSSIRFAGGEAYVYRLTLTTGGFVDHAFPLAVSRANPGAVELRGWNIPDSARQLPVKLGPEPEWFQAFHSACAGSSPVRVEPHPCIVETRPNGPKTPQPITLPVTVSGQIQAEGEVDSFAFDAKKGQKATFRLESRALGFPLDAVLQVTDASGKSLIQVDDVGGRNGARDPELTFTAPQDGKYTLEIRDLHGAGGPRFVYRLRATLADPSWSLTVASDRFPLTPGKPLDISVTLDRANGFNQIVELVAAILPNGVTAIPVPPPPGAPAKTLTLRLTASPEAVSGPFQIIGRVPDLPGQNHPARCAMADLNATSPYLWLTIPPPTGK